MRDLSPAAATVGVAGLLWIAWELLRVLVVRGLLAGVGSAVLDLRVREVGGSWWLEFLVPALFAIVIFVAGLAFGRLRPPPLLGFGLLGLATLAGLLWTAMALLAGATTFLPVGLPLFFDMPDPLSWWGAWGRWWLDLGVLGGIAGLTATGPRTASARRSVFALGLAVLVDSAWRAFVSLSGGEVPVLVTGPGVWAPLIELIWLGAGLFAVLFVGVFANLPDRDGPRRNVLLGLLAVAGLWAGLQAALLFAGGTLQAMGFDGRLLFPTPLYEVLLAALRLGLLLASCAAVGIGVWREEP